MGVWVTDSLTRDFGLLASSHSSPLTAIATPRIDQIQPLLHSLQPFFKDQHQLWLFQINKNMTHSNIIMWIHFFLSNLYFTFKLHYVHQTSNIIHQHQWWFQLIISNCNVSNLWLEYAIWKVFQSNCIWNLPWTLWTLL